MAKEAHVTSEEGFVASIDIREYDMTLDSGAEVGPDTLESLVGTYAACYVPALRVGAEQRNVGDLGRIEIDVVGELNDDDKLDAVSFDVTVNAEVDAEDVTAVVERANALCKVHDALKPSLHADVSINGHAG